MEGFWGLGWLVELSLFVVFLFNFVLINLTGTKTTVQRAGTFFFFLRYLPLFLPSILNILKKDI